MGIAAVRSQGGGSVVVSALFIVAPIVCGYFVWSLFCCVVLGLF